MPPNRQLTTAADTLAPDSAEARRWARVKSVLLDALDLAPDERAAFVARACEGEAELRREVESLLASDADAESLLETPAAAMLEGLDGPASPRLSDGTRLGSYEVTGFVAAGGMGEVYRARHTVLGREVAIKRVGSAGPSSSPGSPAKSGDESARRRLMREARNASTLSHPNICVIHEVGEHDGMPFIVMEYVNGRSLHAILRERRPQVMGIHEILNIGDQVAAALEHAHARGIVHRDLKSSNIVVDAAGSAKVLDFGLARRLPGGGAAADSSITADHVVAGTLTHMSPETLRGDPVDARSDIWALGVVLYELATAELPFSGKTGFETSSSILAEPPAPMSSTVPLALRLLIERCLQKDPKARYQSARDVRDALQAIQQRRVWPVIGRALFSSRRRTLYKVSAAVILLPVALILATRLLDGLRTANGHAAYVPTVALLPLQSVDPQMAYYAEGVTDAVIAQLGAATDARVLSRYSVARAASNARSPRELAAQLGANVLVRGTIRHSDGRVTIALHAVRGSDDKEQWSDVFERAPSDVLALQADVVRGLVLALQSTLRPGMRERLAAVRAVTPAVYEEYLKGRYEWNKRTQKSLGLAMEHFRRAAQLDDSYAPAHAALADCYSQLATVMLGGGSPGKLRPQAAAEAIKALQLDSESAEAHAALGYVWHYQWRWADAERELRRAIELNPSFALAHAWYANLLMSRLRFQEAIREVYVARELDPFSLIINTNVGWILSAAGRSAEAASHLRQTLALDSTYAQAHWRLASALSHGRQFEESILEARRVVALTESSTPSLALLAQTLARAGHRDEARALLATMLDRARAHYVSPGSLGEVYMSLGDIRTAVSWMEKAYNERSNMVAYLSQTAYAPLRSDPRFMTLLARAGLE